MMTFDEQSEVMVGPRADELALWTTTREPD